MIDGVPLSPSRRRLMCDAKWITNTDLSAYNRYARPYMPSLAGRKVSALRGRRMTADVRSVRILVPSRLRLGTLLPVTWCWRFVGG